MWATRAIHESRSYDQNSFITLTFSDEKMPLDRSLSLRTFQLFAKKLRKALEPKKIKFFHCGEYSPQKRRPIGPFNYWEFLGEGQRPHYHALLFNHDFDDKTVWSVRNDIPIYTSDFLTDIWGQGFTTVGELNFESAAYVARYTIKKINGKRDQQLDENGLRPYERVCPITGNITEVAKEYATMSNGIGKDHLLSYTSDVYPLDHVVINGFERRPPRYYDDLYDQINHDSMEEVKQRRVSKMRDHAKDNTPARLAVREKVKQAQLKMLKRELE